jgi:hypothetical protein
MMHTQNRRWRGLVWGSLAFALSLGILAYAEDPEQDSHPQPREALTQPASQPDKFGSPYGYGLLRLGNGCDLRLSLIPAGTFVMGDDTDVLNSGAPAHHVTLTHPYYMAVYLATRQLYVRVLGMGRYLNRRGAGAPTLRDGTIQNPQRPMLFTWSEAVAFCNHLSRMTGSKVRLPTEAEWERACRAGTDTRYFWGNDSRQYGEYTWTNEEWDRWQREGPKLAPRGDEWPPPVGQYKPNPWGLYDECNHAQWCSDWFETDYYYKIKKIPQIDPTGPQSPKPVEPWLPPGHSTRGGTTNHTPRGGGFEGNPPGLGAWKGKPGTLAYVRFLVEAPLSPPREFTGVFKLREIKQGKCLDEACYIAFATAVGNIAGSDGTMTAFGVSNPDKPATTGGVKLASDLASLSKPDDTIKAHSLAQLVIPNQLTAEKLPAPDMYALFKDTKAGSLLKIKIRAIPGQSMYDVISPEHYKLAPGEDKPGVYVFQRTATMTLQKADHPAVILSKYLEETTLAVINPHLAAAMDKFKTGDSVRVGFEGKVLQSIEAYKP